MSGTTLCPHCNTRFKIAEPQLEAHHGMVRCGHCLQAFDARPGYIPDQPNPQLELPILDEPVEPPEKLPAGEPPTAGAAGETVAAEEDMPVEETGAAEETEPVEESGPAEETASAEEPGLIEAIPSADEADAGAEPPEIPYDDLLDFNQPAAVEDETRHAGFPLPNPDGTTSHSTKPASGQVAGYLPQAGEGADESLRELHVNAAEEPVAEPLTLAEQVAIVQDEVEEERPAPPAYRRWPWAVAAFLLLLVLLAQAAYFFRVDLAARLPGLKPALTGYCKLLGCSVPLPQKTDLMSIESSDLEADPVHVNQITLNALLRNRASYPQAFPSLELTLNDTQDKPLARRIFKPRDYLPPHENEQTGLLPNHELIVKLYLNTNDLRPTGYRLVLFYPQ